MCAFVCAKIKKYTIYCVFAIDLTQYICYTYNANRCRQVCPYADMAYKGRFWARQKQEGEITVNIQGYQKLTLLDYPGKTACTVFTGGCNFRCPFCHNAPLVEHPNEYRTALDEVLEYLQKRKGLLDGVCITGGEPLLQKDIAQFIAKVKAMGYSVKLDTNGGLPERLKEVIGLVDYVAMDVKSSPGRYCEAAGCPVELESVEKSIGIIKQSGVEYEFRTTVVKGLHDEKTLSELALWLGEVKRYYLQGYVDSGDILGDKHKLSAFTPSEMKSLLSIVRKYVPSACLRGIE